VACSCVIKTRTYNATRSHPEFVAILFSHDKILTNCVLRMQCGSPLNCQCGLLAWSLMKNPVLTEEVFGRFLKWLHPDLDQAAQTYESVRRRLIIFFNCRNCTSAEDLADKTINRVISQISALANSYQGDPARYFYGVANYIYLEHCREQNRMDGKPVPDDWPDPARQEDTMEKELIAHCLNHCLQKLPSAKRELFISYYQTDKQPKFDHHKLLAEGQGCSINALRLQMMRLRAELRECITNCQRFGLATENV
jgi:RNA polymerase sigma factor (sigma-70 family)